MIFLICSTTSHCKHYGIAKNTDKEKLPVCNRTSHCKNDSITKGNCKGRRTAIILKYSTKSPTIDTVTMVFPDQKPTFHTVTKKKKK
eukprot:Gb_29599 [translate_table: standard]